MATEPTAIACIARALVCVCVRARDNRGIRALRVGKSELPFLRRRRIPPRRRSNASEPEQGGAPGRARSRYARGPRAYVSGAPLAARTPCVPRAAPAAGARAVRAVLRRGIVSAAQEPVHCDRCAMPPPCAAPTAAGAHAYSHGPPHPRPPKAGHPWHLKSALRPPRGAVPISGKVGGKSTSTKPSSNPCLQGGGRALFHARSASACKQRQLGRMQAEREACAVSVETAPRANGVTPQPAGAREEVSRNADERTHTNMQPLSDWSQAKCPS